MMKKKSKDYSPQYTADELDKMRSAVVEFCKQPAAERIARIKQLNKSILTVDRAAEISENTMRAVRNIQQTGAIVKPLCGEIIDHAKTEWSELMVAVTKQFGISPGEIASI